jgi:glutathione S-transferase
MTANGLAALCLVSLAMLLVYMWTAIRVGRARGAMDVKAPATEGPDAFNRVYRAHVNTLEQLVLALPAFWILAQGTRVLYVCILASVWIVGRIYYVLSYAQAAEKRSMGFMLSALPTLVAIIWAAVVFALVLVPR